MRSLRQGEPGRRQVLRRVRRTAPDALSLVRHREPAEGQVLHRVRRLALGGHRGLARDEDRAARGPAAAGRRGSGARGSGEASAHRHVLRPGQLHPAVAVPRPRGPPGAHLRLPGVLRPGGRALRGDDRAVPGGRDPRLLRLPVGPRGRRAARGAGRDRDPGGDGQPAGGRPREGPRRAGRAHRHPYRPGGGGRRRGRDEAREPRARRHSQHRGAPPGPRRAEHDHDQPGDPPADPGLLRDALARHPRPQGSGGADGGADRPQGERHPPPSRVHGERADAVGGERDRARGHAGGVGRGARGPRAGAPRHGRGRHREVAPRARARGGGGTHLEHLAPGVLLAVLRQHRALPHPRAGALERGVRARGREPGEAAEAAGIPRRHAPGPRRHGAPPGRAPLDPPRCRLPAPEPVPAGAAAQDARGPCADPAPLVRVEAGAGRDRGPALDGPLDARPPRSRHPAAAGPPGAPPADGPAELRVAVGGRRPRPGDPPLQPPDAADGRPHPGGDRRARPAAGRGVAARGEDGRHPSLHRGDDPDGARGGDAQGRGRPLRAGGRAPEADHSRDAPRLADGAPGSHGAGREEDRPDRRLHRPRVQPRPVERRASRAGGGSPRRPRTPGRSAARLRPGQPGQRPLLVQARPHPGRRLRVAAAPHAAGVPRAHRAGPRARAARPHRATAGAARPALHEGGAAREGDPVLAGGGPARGGDLRERRGRGPPEGRASAGGVAARRRRAGGPGAGAALDPRHRPQRAAGVRVGRGPRRPTPGPRSCARRSAGRPSSSGSCGACGPSTSCGGSTTRRWRSARG